MKRGQAFFQPGLWDDATVQDVEPVIFQAESPVVSVQEEQAAPAVEQEEWLAAGDLRLIRRLRLRLRRRYGGQEPIHFADGKGLRSRVHLEETGRGLEVRFPRSWSLKQRHPWHLALTGTLPKPPKRVLAKRGSGPDQPAPDLHPRARQLAQQYLPPLPLYHFFWSPRLSRTWGLCDPNTGVIRLSLKAQELPQVALDYLLVHEMIHLLVPNHGKRFQRLVRGFPGMKEARKILRKLDLEEARQLNDGN